MNNEDIKVLEELKNKKINVSGNLYSVKWFELTERERQAIENLIKRNKELEKKNKRYEKYLRNKDIEHEKVLEYIETEKEIDYIPKSKLQELLKNAEEKYQTYKKGVDENENLKFGMWRYLGQVQILKDLLGISRNIVTLDSEELLQEKEMINNE